LEDSCCSTIRTTTTTTTMMMIRQMTTTMWSIWTMRTTRVFIAIRDPPASRFGATNAEPLFARIVTGVTNIKPITKFGSAIGAMPFTVGRAMKWISAKIVVRWFAEPVRRCCPANSAGEECAKSAPRRVGGAALFCALATPNLQWTAILADFLTVWFVWQVEIKIPV